MCSALFLLVLLFRKYSAIIYIIIGFLAKKMLICCTIKRKVDLESKTESYIENYGLF